MSERAVWRTDANVLSAEALVSELGGGAVLTDAGLKGVAAALTRLGRPEGVAAAQGLLLGLWARSAGQAGDALFAAWLAELGIDSWHAVENETLAAFAWLFRASLGSVASAGGGVAFSLALPADDAPWHERLKALSDWCDHLLYGYGLRDHAVTPDPDTAEVLTELAAIARLPVPGPEQPIEDDDANEADFVELVEFLRIAPLLLLGPDAQPVDVAPANPGRPQPHGHAKGAGCGHGCIGH